jgi:hypothetical protein
MASRWQKRSFALLVTAQGSLFCSCSGDLPAVSFVEKLRVLAVRAEPPEVAPGDSAVLDALVVEPAARPSIDQVSYLWLACPALQGVTIESPCGIQSAISALPPNCKEVGSDHTCLLSTAATASVTPDSSLLGERGIGTLLLTLVVSDGTSAIECWRNVVENGGLPTDPDHCVVSYKRLSVSAFEGQADGDEMHHRNQNPGLVEFGMREERGGAEPASLLDGTATVAPSLPTAKSRRELVMTRANEAAELKSDGGYEILSVSWFTDRGILDGARSTFRSEECPTQLDCPKGPPPATTTNDWVAPTDTGPARFWVVLRDDRGGVGWLAGMATILP